MEQKRIFDSLKFEDAEEVNSYTLEAANKLKQIFNILRLYGRTRRRRRRWEPVCFVSFAVPSHLRAMQCEHAPNAHWESNPSSSPSLSLYSFECSFWPRTKSCAFFKMKINVSYVLKCSCVCERALSRLAVRVSGWFVYSFAYQFINFYWKFIRFAVRANAEHRESTGQSAWQNTTSIS